MKKLLALALFLLITSQSFGQTPPNYVESFKDVQSATFNLVCRSNVTRNNMGGGSGSAIYQKENGLVLIVTALHVTEGCAEIGGSLYVDTNEKVKDILGNSYDGEALYIPLVEIAKDPQHDLSLVGTTKPMPSGQKVYKIADKDLEYAQRVYTAGFPGLFRIPPTIIMTEGIVNAPHAKVRACAMTEENIRRSEIRRGFFRDVIGLPAKSLGVWDCADDSRYQTVYIDLVIHDADIGPGNSGGTLFNEKFELVGVTVVGYKLMNWRPGSIPIQYVRTLLMTTPYGKTILQNGK